MNIKLLISLSLLICLSGCISSINPLYTENDVILNDDLIGTWKDSKAKQTWEFEKTDERVYKLTHQENNEQAIFEATLLQLGEYTYLDIYPVEYMHSNSFEYLHNLPVHSFSKVTLTDHALSLQMLDEEWLEKGLMEKKLDIRHTKTSDGRVLLTSPTAELQSFMLAHADNEDAFGEALVLARK